ncbi:hypothetical protein C5167_029621 [Papaver somniferum]|nr:hypothetical protein C5167_029621 [Papaver somniferum]
MGDNRGSYVETIASLGSNTYLERQITDGTVKNPKRRRLRAVVVFLHVLILDLGVEDIRQLDLQREDDYFIVAKEYGQGSDMSNSRGLGKE